MPAISRIALTAALLLSSSAAWAHAGLVSSEPGRRAVLATAPKEIRLCFNENIEARYSQVTLVREGQETGLSLGALQVDPAKPACLFVPIQSPLDKGSYTVRYRVLSVDGHVVDYGYGFRLNPP
jgi:methionine-rich copper-binding protein CopC